MIAAELRQRLFEWVFRLPGSETAPVTLHRRRVYILPTRFGCVYALMLVLLLVGSINYALSLGFVLTFLLAALGCVGMVHTYRNLLGVQVRWMPAAPVFAPGPAAFTLLLACPGEARFALRLTCGEAPPAEIDIEGGSGRVRLALPAPRRGVMRMPPVSIETRYPLGLFRVWARVKPEASSIVYPTPAPPGTPLPPLEGGETGAAANRPGSDELQFLRPYRPGDSPRHIAWRAWARGRELLAKQFAGEGGGQLWLDFAAVPGADLERKLSVLARWVLDAEARGLAYGLRLPGTEIPPAGGAEHRHRVLKALALYGNP